MYKLELQPFGQKEMLKHTYICICGFLTIFSNQVDAQNLDQRTLKALNNVQHDMMTCSIYYKISASCLDPQKDKPLISNMNSASKEIFTRGYQLGKSIGMTEDAIISRSLIESENMREIIEGNCINISSIINRYGKYCKVVYDNPDAILKKYIPDLK